MPNYFRSVILILIMPETSAAESLARVVNLIQNANTSIEKLKEEISTNKDMLEDALNNDPDYRREFDKAKEAAKVRNELKKRIMLQPELMSINTKMKNQKTHLKELKETLSEYLQEYQRQTGSKTIEDSNGELNQIISSARLVKTSNRPE